MTTLPMTPIPVPPEAAATRPALRALSIGPPPGVSSDECGTLECLVGFHEQGYPMYAGYWRPTTEQLAALQAGGFIELVQYAPRLVMHSMTVWAAGPDPVEGCGWVDCQDTSDHEHASSFEWVNPGDPTAGKVVVDVAGDGTVQLSEAALAQLLTDAGWERAR
jgi:hypothetical protein